MNAPTTPEELVEEIREAFHNRLFRLYDNEAATLIAKTFERWRPDPNKLYDELTRNTLALSNAIARAEAAEREVRRIDHAGKEAYMQCEAAEKRVRELTEGLQQIAEVEQSHCYEMFDEANPLMTARNDLRSCGDIARALLKEVRDGN